MVSVLAKTEKQVFLPWLTENHPIEGQPLLQPFELPNLLAVREQRNAALHPGGTILEDPIRDEIGMPIGFASGRDLEKSLPRVALLMSFRKSSQTIPFRNIFPDSMPFIAMNPTFALFKVNGIGRQVPMDYRNPS
jgi:hypothetical protein